MTTLKHKATSIKENPNKRFVSDVEKAKWNQTQIKLNEIKTLKDNGYVTTLETDYLTIDNCIEGYSKNTVISGNTLVNLIKNGSQIQEIKALVGQGSNRQIAKYDYIYNIDNLTTLTLFAKIKKIDNPSNTLCTTSLNSGNNGMNNISSNDINRGYTIQKYNSNHSGKNAIWFYGGNDSGLNIQIYDLILLEGDHTNKSYEYFEGIQGVGDLTSDNRYSINTVVNNSGNLAFNTTYKNGVHIDRDKGIEKANASFSATDYIAIRSNTKIRTINANFHVVYFDRDKQFIKTPYANGYDHDHTTISPSNAKYIRLSVPIANQKKEGLYYIEKGNQSIPNKNYTNSIYLNQQLNKLPNGVKDTIEYIDNKLYLVKRVGKVILDGSDGPRTLAAISNNRIRSYIDRPSKARKPKDNSDRNYAISNMFIMPNSQIDGNSLSENRYDYAAYFAYGLDVFSIVLPVNAVETSDVEGVNKWLSQEKPEFLYELEQPEYIELPNYDINYKLYKDRTHIWFDNNISPTIKLDYPISISGSVSSSLTQISEIKEELKDIEKLEEEYKFNYTAGVDGSLECIETNNSYVDDISIKGNSIKNLYDMNYPNAVGGSVQGSESEYRTIMKTGTWLYSYTNGYDSYGNRTLSNKRLLKPNTTYIYIIIPTQDIPIDKTKAWFIFTSSTAHTGFDSEWVLINEEVLKANTSYTWEFTTPNDLGSRNGVGTRIYFNEDQSNKTFYYDNFLIEKTSDYVPDYFEGLQSTNPIIKTTSINNTNLIDYSNIDLAKLPVEYGLKKLPNGIYDEIIKSGDSYKLIQRVGYKLLSDIENWDSIKAYSQTWLFRTPLPEAKSHVYNYETIPTDCISNIAVLKYDTYSQTNAQTESLTIMHRNNNAGVHLYVNKNSTQDIAALKSWFAEKNVLLYYELAVPIEYDLGNISPKTFMGDTRVEIDSNIPPTEFKFSITSSIGNTLKVLMDKIAVLEKKAFNETKTNLANVLTEIDNKFKLDSILYKIKK